MKNYQLSKTNIPAVDKTNDEIIKLINELSNSVNNSQKGLGSDTVGKSGDIQFIKGEDNSGYLLVKGGNGFNVTFQGCFQPYGKTTPILHLKNLTVDNLFAKMFTVNQTNAFNGDTLISASGVIDYVTGTDIYIKDQTNLNTCAFAVGDTCEIRSVNVSTGLDIRLVQFTVTAVNGRKITVSFKTGTGTPKSGDIIVRKGNTTTASRQNSIFFKVDTTGVPYMDLYTGVTGFTFPNPKVCIGDLTHIADSTFNPVAPYHLSGSGLYANNVYLKGKFQIASNADLIGYTPPQATYTSGTTFPGSPKEGDWHFYTGTTSPYTKNTWYRYSGSAWVSQGTVGTYIDGTGIYTGTIVCSQITAGTMTGFTIQTSTSGNRVVMSNGDEITFYNLNSVCGTLSGHTVSSIGTGASFYAGGGFISGDETAGNNTYYSLLQNSGLSIEHVMTLVPDVRYTCAVYDNSGITFKNTSNNTVFTISLDGTIGGSGAVWNGTAIGDSYIASASTWNAKLDSSSSLNPANVSQTSSYRFVTDTEKSTWNAKLDSSSSLNPANVSQTSSYRFVTDTEKSTWNAKLDSSSITEVTLNYKDHSGTNQSINVLVLT